MRGQEGRRIWSQGKRKPGRGSGLHQDKKGVCAKEHAWGGGGGKAARSVSEILGVQCGKNKGGGGVWGRGGPGAEERKVKRQTGSGRSGGSFAIFSVRVSQSFK